MVRIIPTALSEAYSGFHSSAEKRVYEKASAEPSDDCYVFHDFRWFDPSLNSSSVGGQIDFIIANPEFGYLCLEVKGGRCSYDPKTNCWITRDGNQKQHEIKDPFEQALVASKVLLELLLRQNKMFIPHSHAVIFPDCIFKKESLGDYLKANIQMWQILDRHDLFDFKKSILHLFERAFEDTRITRTNGMKIIKGIQSLYGSKSLEGEKPTYAEIRESYEKIIKLTDRQIELLRYLRDNKKLFIAGCAGSGKTMLALHKAKTLAQEGKNVLLLCFNIPLGTYLEKECSLFPSITAGPFLELCVSWLESAGVNVSREDTQQFYEDRLPNLVFENMTSIPASFDAVIVDEAQDFKESHWAVVELLLKDSDETCFYIFADSNQNIYGGSTRYPVDTPSVRLEKNVRNTNQVFQAVASCCNIEKEMKSSGVDGPPVQIQSYVDAEDMLARIEAQLGIIVKEGVPISDVAILGTKSQENTCLKHGSRIGPFLLKEKRSDPKDLVTMSYRRFKGLESRVIILCELEEGVKDLQEVLYVGMTRSTGMLLLLVKESFREALENIGFSLNSALTGESS